MSIEALKNKINASPATQLGIFNFATTALEGTLSSMAAASSAKASASAYRSNARLAILQGMQQNQLLNAELGQNAWNIMAERDAFLGQQYAAMAFSGFADVSSGDKRLINDTKRRTADYVEGLNSSAQLQAFENWRSSMLEANRLNYAAKRQDLIAKQNSGFGATLNILTNSILNGLGSYYGAKAISPKNGLDVNVAGGVKGA